MRLQTLFAVCLTVIPYFLFAQPQVNIPIATMAIFDMEGCNGCAIDVADSVAPQVIISPFYNEVTTPANVNPDQYDVTGFTAAYDSSRFFRFTMGVADFPSPGDKYCSVVAPTQMVIVDQRNYEEVCMPGAGNVCGPFTMLDYVNEGPDTARLQFRRVGPMGYTELWETVQEWQVFSSLSQHTIDLTSLPVLPANGDTIVEFRVQARGGANFNQWYSVDSIHVAGALTPVAVKPTDAIEDVICTGDQATISATPSVAATLVWYPDSTSTSPVGSGQFWQTPNLFTQTTYWAESETNFPFPSCESAERLPVTVFMADSVSNNTIFAGGLTSSCESFKPDTIQGTVPAGGDGIYTYQWEYRAPSSTTWTAIFGADKQYHVPDTLSGVGQHQFRRVVTACDTDYVSNALDFDILSLPAIVGNAIFPPTTTEFCAGGNPGMMTGSVTPTLSGGGGAPYSYQWEAKSPNGIWQDAPGVNDQADYDPPALSIVGDWQFRRRVGSTCQGFSNTLTISITSPDVTFLPQDPSTAAATDGSIDVTVSGGVQPYTYDWQGPGTVNGQQDQTGLGIGEYLLTVTDAISCTAITTIDLRGNEIGGIVNTYVGVTGYPAPNAVSLDAATLRGAGLGSNVGDRFQGCDRVIVIQMQGAEIDSTAFNNDYGDITDLGEAGLYEFATIASVSGNVVVFSDDLENSYSGAPEPNTACN